MRQIESNNYEKNSKELLMKLSKEISDNFSINLKLAEKYILSESINSLDDLKNDLLKNNEELAEIDLNKLYNSIENKKEKINIFVKNEIKKLKDILPEKVDGLLTINNLNTDNEVIRKIFSSKLINKAKNPNNISEQILWASLGTANSLAIFSKVVYNFWKWIVTSVPDGISILNWTWEMESIKKV